MIIPALVMYSCLLLLTASSKAQSLVLHVLPLFMFALVLEVLLRCYAEVGDFW